MTAPRNSPPFDRRVPGESARAYAAFCVYRDLPPAARSVDRAYEAVRAADRQQSDGQQAAHGRHRAPRRWFAWSSAWRWPERAAAYDAHLDEARLRAAEAAAADEAAAWEHRRREWREREWSVALGLLDRADQMRKWPLSRQKVVREGGRAITIVEPTRWRLRDAAALLGAASKVGRLATDMATDRPSSAEAAGPADDIDRLLDRLGEDALRGLIAAVPEKEDGEGQPDNVGPAEPGDG